MFKSSAEIMREYSNLIQENNLFEFSDPDKELNDNTQENDKYSPESSEDFENDLPDGDNTSPDKLHPNHQIKVNSNDDPVNNLATDLSDKIGHDKNEILEVIRQFLKDNGYTLAAGLEDSTGNV